MTTTNSQPEAPERPVRCHFCHAPMYYANDPRYRPEVRIEAHSGTSRMFDEFYAHQDCWNTRARVPSGVVGTVDMLLPVIHKAAKEPCRTFSKGCASYQPDESYWCAPCSARKVLGAVPVLHWPFAPKHDNCAECAKQYEPPPLTAAAAPPFCGFCGKSNTEVRTLIKAPVGYICEECVTICADMIKHDAAVAPQNQHKWADRVGQYNNDPMWKEVKENVEAARASQDELVDEVQRRMDQVVEAAVEWHQAGREGGEWFDAAERLGAAIDSLLELRTSPVAPAQDDQKLLEKEHK